MEGERETGVTATSLSVEAPRYTRHTSGAVLRVLSGPDRGAALVIGGQPVLIGGSTECELVLTDPTVSRTHARATWNGRHVEVDDLGSKNGSHFEGARIERAEVGLGAEFRVGHTVIKVLPEEEEIQTSQIDPSGLQEQARGRLVGRSPAMLRLFATIDQIAGTDSLVLIEGETGTGKELVAEEIHARSARAERMLALFDCGAVPEQLIESTLFGHVRGAFTGATHDRSGIFQEADGGTVFLDEIGELELSLQPALLRVLDRGMVRPVGATSYANVDVRVIAATHRNLAESISEGRFREDLYYRLAVVRLYVPPLRDRLEDIALLVRRFLQQLGRPDLEPSAEDLAALSRHDWPGNVRELRNVVERGVALSAGGRFELRAAPRGAPKRVTAAAGGPRKPFREAKAEVVERFEREYLSELMAEFGNVAAAAAGAHMDRKHLTTLLRRHGLKDT